MLRGTPATTGRLATPQQSAGGTSLDLNCMFSSRQVFNQGSRVENPAPVGRFDVNPRCTVPDGPQRASTARSDKAAAPPKRLRVVITGASGNVGTGVLRALSIQIPDADVVGVCRRPPDKGHLTERIRWHAIDLAAP